MKCDYCGTEINENDTICKGCGVKIERSFNKEQTPTNVNPVTQVIKPSIPNNPNQNNPEFKRTSPLVIALIVLIGLASVGFSIYKAYDYFKTNDKEDKNNSKEDDNELDSDLDYDSEIPSDYKRVGTIDYGYIDIPKEWIVFTDNSSYVIPMMQYSNKTGREILTMTSNPNPSSNAEDTAINLYNSLIDEGASNVDGATLEVDGYTAYQVYGYYENDDIWLCTWSFIDADGTLHYVALESPDRYSEIFDLIDTYSVYK